MALPFKDNVRHHLTKNVGTKETEKILQELLGEKSAIMSSTGRLNYEDNFMQFMIEHRDFSIILETECMQ